MKILSVVPLYVGDVNLVVSERNTVCVQIDCSMHVYINHCVIFDVCFKIFIEWSWTFRHNSFGSYHSIYTRKKICTMQLNSFYFHLAFLTCVVNANILFILVPVYNRWPNLWRDRIKCWVTRKKNRNFSLLFLLMMGMKIVRSLNKFQLKWKCFIAVKSDL